ncbi:MAG: hypothetical protein NT099_00580 [Candidatus Saganbacteria bacterium]|nr:hypothetical protein [Candidatus Saganbacteria bacterium]
MEKKKDKLDQILDKLEWQGKKLEEHDGGFNRIEDSLKAQAAEFIIVYQKIDKLDDKIDDKFNNVLVGVDKVMGELEKAREDRITAKSKDDDQDERLDKIELVVGIKSA